MACLYRHIRLDKQEPFYIGIGDKTNRAYSLKNRNKYWKNIVNLQKGLYNVEILIEDITWEEACIKEKEFIKLYGRSDLKQGPLCNLTDGGEGVLGLKLSEDIKFKIAQRLKGIKPSDECYKQAKLKNSGSGNSNYGKSIPDWHKEINRKAQLGRVHSKETIELRSFKLRKKVINTSTGEIFESITETAIKYNKSPSHMTRLIKLNKYNLKFI